MLLKEWIYTVRNSKAVLISIFAPAVIAAGYAIRALDPQRDPSPILIFYSLYSPLTFAIVYRSVQRIQVDGETGLGLLYVRTKTSLSRILLVKWLFECLIGLAAVSIPTVILLMAPRSTIGAIGVVQIILAACVMTALTFLLACFFLTPELLSIITSAIVIYPILYQPGFLDPQAGLGMEIFRLVFPPATAFSGLNALSVGSSPSTFGMIAMVVQTTIMIAYARPAFRWYLARKAVQ